MMLKGILKKDYIKEYTRKDGTSGKKRYLYIEPVGSVYPVRVATSDQERKYGKVGQEIEVPVRPFAFYFENGQRKKANLEFFIPNDPE